MRATAQRRSTRETAESFPRIYCLPQFHDAALTHAAFDHAGSLGFTHLLLAPVAEAPSPKARRAGDAGKAVGDLAGKAQQLGLKLLVDLTLDRFAADGELARQHTGWFEPAAADELPDPRRPPVPPDVAVLRWGDEAIAAQATRHFATRLERWIDAGVAGFRCLSPAALPASVWRALIGSAKGADFIAWTAGLAPAQLTSLAGCGFRATMFAIGDADLRGSALLHRLADLERVAPPIAAVADPFADGAAAYGDAAIAERTSRRALRLAAATARGMMVPLGFEFGARSGFAEALDLPTLRSAAAFDLTRDIREANAWLGGLQGPARLSLLTGADAACSAWLRRSAGLLILVNPDLNASRKIPFDQILPRAGGLMPEAAGLEAELQPGEVRLLPVQVPKPVATDAESAEAAARAPRISIEAVMPCVDQGRFPAKRLVGETVRVEADVFGDGHDQLAAVLRWRCADDAAWHEARMAKGENDRWQGEFPLERAGRHEFQIQAWLDRWASHTHALRKKVDAGQDVDLEIQEALPMLPPQAAAQLRNADPDAQILTLLSEATAAVVAVGDSRPFAVSSGVYPLMAEREAAVFGAWYEIFPRSASQDETRHGTFDDVIAQLPRIRALGFDVLYFPPIHPIGRSHRKGRNNSLRAQPGEPGSPYAIGSAEGGHDAIHPELGTLDDFHNLVHAAHAHDLELALDFAIQCSPDHPWLRQHPDWFAWRPDGTLRYAENPPKKYEDIVNVDFYAQGAVPALWLALRDVVLFWIEHGVKLFRVDNPHTKPFPFWEWLIADVRGRHPDAIFLSEAFTRPKPMKRLAKLGFSQSYTYFTWRHGKKEFTEYLTELTQTDAREYFRPHFFVNTPDINPFFLQSSGRAGFLIRAALASTLSGLWGVYSGFELCEARALPGKEEYLDSEKYQLRAWDWNRPGNINAEIAALNRIRHENPALRSHLGLTFYNAFNDQVLYFGKATPNRDNVVLVAISLDPHHAQGADFEIPLWEWGLPDHAALQVDDLLSGQRFVWHGKRQHLWLDPARPYALWRVQPVAS